MSKFLILLLIFFVYCNTGRVKTSKEYINNEAVESSFYTKDSLGLYGQLFDSMINHTASFTNPEYFDSTQLIIDTILYDSTFEKVALFVIAKIPTYRNPYSDSKMPYYFNGACYLGKRLRTGSVDFNIKYLGPFRLVNFDNNETIRKALKDYYFLQLTTVLDEKGRSTFKYNLNDHRFWESETGWKRTFKE